MDRTEELARTLASSLQKFDLNDSNGKISSLHKDNTCLSSFPASVSGAALPYRRRNCPKLLSLCLEVVGRHLEDIITDLADIAISLPSDIKMVIAAIARRRKLLTDETIIALADASWEILDISGSDITDSGLTTVSQMCGSLSSVDISRCSNITPKGVSQLVQSCRSLEILRCGGCPRSDYTARRSLNVFIPKLQNVEEDCWEELDANEIADGAQSLQWLVWPKIDADSLRTLSSECPRIKVNPQPSLFSYKGISIPAEAFPDTVLDDFLVKDMDPGTWAVVVSTSAPRLVSQPTSTPNELSIAEKFRLAFEERDMRLAPKRAKNARQRQRRAQREWMMTSPEGKALLHASRMNKSQKWW